MLSLYYGTKDSGYLMANWRIYKTKKALTPLLEQVWYRDVVFFDG
ncbi:MAG: hypothetical protein ABI045_01650 [Flavobacteriales bacterium]